MGHSNILVSQGYVHPTPERLETAFAGLHAYNQERAQAAKAKSEKETATKTKALSQTA
jgi:hypothetical protein